MISKSSKTPRTDIDPRVPGIPHTDTKDCKCHKCIIARRKRRLARKSK